MSLLSAPCVCAVGLAPTLTFLSLVFWSFVVGPLGALLAVPLSLLAKALLVDADPHLRWLEPLLGDSTHGGDDEGTGPAAAPDRDRPAGGDGRSEHDEPDSGGQRARAGTATRGSGAPVRVGGSRRATKAAAGAAGPASGRWWGRIWS